MEAVKAANQDVGGPAHRAGRRRIPDPRRGYVKTRKTWRTSWSVPTCAAPDLLKNLGTVQMGGAIRRGLLEMNAKARRGRHRRHALRENAKEVIDRVKIRFKELEKGLAARVKIMVPMTAPT